MNVAGKNSQKTALFNIGWEMGMPRDRLRTRWQDYVEHLSWSRVGILLDNLPFVADDRDAWKIPTRAAATATLQG